MVVGGYGLKHNKKTKVFASVLFAESFQFYYFLFLEIS